MPKKILVAEEDHFLRKIYGHKLRVLGVEIIEVATGSEVLQKAISEKPDLILLDIMLPGKNGFDILLELSSHKETKNIPAIVLSNLAQKEDIERALSLGAKAYLIKSEASLSEIVNKVKEWLAKSSK
jgi:CheY-like chemotaxis protein